MRFRIRDPGPGAFLTLDPDPGSGTGFFRIPDLGSRIPTPYFWPVLRFQIRDPGPGAFLTLDPDPGSGTGFFRIPDLGSRIPTPYFLELSNKVLGKRFYNSLKTGPRFFLQHSKNRIIFNFVKFVATKIGSTTKLFTPLLLLLFLDPGSGMGKNQDPGSGINIPDPQHWFWHC